MSDLLLLAFDGLDESVYAKVNAELGIDAATGTGNWPAGLVTHLAGKADDGKFHVVEVWESRKAQEEFMHSRLGAALAGAGVTSQPSVTWAGVTAQHNPGL